HAHVLIVDLDEEASRCPDPHQGSRAGDDCQRDRPGARRRTVGNEPGGASRGGDISRRPHQGAVAVAAASRMTGGHAQAFRGRQPVRRLIDIHASTGIIVISVVTVPCSSTPARSPSARNSMTAAQQSALLIVFIGQASSTLCQAYFTDSNHEV